MESCRRPQEGKEFDQARQDFKNSVNNIPSNATIGQVQSNIEGSRPRLESAYDNLQSSVRRPQQGKAPSSNQPSSNQPSSDMQR